MAAKTLSVVFTDIKGFTDRTAKGSRAQMVRILHKHEELLKPIVLAHGGVVVKTIGDAFLLTFESPTNAVLCGVRMQATLRRYNLEAPADEQIEIRVAINTGEVEVIGNDIFGETVNISSRVEGITDAGEVYFTEATYLAMSKNEVPTSNVGEFRLKGVPEAIRVYRVVQDENLELYKKVLATQEVPDEVGAAPTMEAGQLGESLLYSVEQQRALLGRRRLDPVITGVVAAVVLLLGAGGWVGVRALSYKSQRTKAEHLIAAGQTRDALDIIAALRKSRPTDDKLRDLLASAIRADVESIIADNRHEQALQRIDEYRAEYPNIEVLDELTRDARLAQAEFRYDSNVKEAHQLMEKLYEDYPNDHEIKYRFAYRCATAPYVRNIERALYLYDQLIKEHPEIYQNHEAVIAHTKDWLQERGGTDYEGTLKTLATIAKYHFETLEPFLRGSLDNPERKGQTLRRNAYLMLKQEGELTEEDEFRFYTAELLGRQNTVEGTFYDETVAYFDAHAESGFSEELMQTLPAQISEAVSLKYNNEFSAWAMPIITKYYADHLKDFLVKTLSDSEDTNWRINAHKVLAEKGWISEEMEADYHLAGLADYNSYWAREYIDDALQYFASGKGSQHKDEAIPLIREIEEGSSERIKKLAATKPAEVGPFRKQHDLAKRALRTLES